MPALFGETKLSSCLCRLLFAGWMRKRAVDSQVVEKGKWRKILPDLRI